MIVVFGTLQLQKEFGNSMCECLSTSTHKISYSHGQCSLAIVFNKFLSCVLLNAEYCHSVFHISFNKLDFVLGSFIYVEASWSVVKLRVVGVIKWLQILKLILHHVKFVCLCQALFHLLTLTTELMSHKLRVFC
jgi:hypothetical protein